MNKETHLTTFFNLFRSPHQRRLLANNRGRGGGGGKRKKKRRKKGKGKRRGANKFPLCDSVDFSWRIREKKKKRRRERKGGRETDVSEGESRSL